MEDQQSQPFLDGKSYDEYSKLLFSTLIQATRLSNTLPNEDDYAYYTAFPTFPPRMKKLGQTLLHRCHQIMAHTTDSSANITNIDPQVDDLNGRFTDVVESLDALLEQVDLYLDGREGETEKSNVVAKTLLFREKGQRDREIIHAKNIMRPQEAWRHRIDNSYGVFIPRLTKKPNAKQALNEVFIQKQKATVVTENTKSVSKAMEVHLSNLGLNKTLEATISVSYPHPYEHELQTFVPLPEQLTPVKEILYRSLEETPLTWVTTPEQMSSLVDLLKKQTEFAVDLEHHSYRTFQGFTCLIQISTRAEDFLIDPLVLMDDLEILNEAFTDPKIVKVLHGSDSDIQWLQRDFGVYIVNMFDTGQASRVLEMASHRLSSLLTHYCNINVDKKYQLAEPLPEEMAKYAREDTHYLLYVYDRLRNEAITRGNEANNLLTVILHRSRDICLKTYEKDQLDTESHLELYNKFGDILTDEQLRIFAAVYYWRDRTAREEDESVRYVLPDKMLFNIAKSIPKDTNQLLICCTPTPPLLRVHASDVVLLIQDALESNPTALPKTTEKPTEPKIIETPKKAYQSRLPIQLQQNEKEEKREAVPIKLFPSNKGYKNAAATLFAMSDEDSLDEEQKRLVESIKDSIETDFFSMKKDFATSVAAQDTEADSAIVEEKVERMDDEPKRKKEIEEQPAPPKEKPKKELKSIKETYNLKDSGFKTKQQLNQERKEKSLKRNRESAAEPRNKKRKQ